MDKIPNLLTTGILQNTVSGTAKQEQLPCRTTRRLIVGICPQSDYADIGGKYSDYNTMALVRITNDVEVCQQFWSNAKMRPSFDRREGTDSVLANALLSTAVRPATIKPELGWAYIEFTTGNVEVYGMINTSEQRYVLNIHMGPKLYRGRAREDWIFRSGRAPQYLYSNLSGEVTHGTGVTLSMGGGELRASVDIADCKGSAVLVRWAGIPDTPIGLCREISLPHHDEGYSRKYLNAQIRDGSLSKLIDVSFSSTTFDKPMQFERHSHANDDVRVIVSGQYEFKLDDGMTILAGAGDVVSMPAYTNYVERVLIPGTVVTGRLTTALHHAVSLPVLGSQPGPATGASVAAQPVAIILGDR